MKVVILELIAEIVINHESQCINNNNYYYLKSLLAMIMKNI